MVYGCLTNLRIFHQTDRPAQMNHYNNLSPACKRHPTNSPAVVKPLDHLRPHPCALPHACSMHVRSDHRFRIDTQMCVQKWTTRKVRQIGYSACHFRRKFAPPLLPSISTHVCTASPPPRLNHRVKEYRLHNIFF